MQGQILLVFDNHALGSVEKEDYAQRVLAALASIGKVSWAVNEHNVLVAMVCDTSLLWQKPLGRALTNCNALAARMQVLCSSSCSVQKSDIPTDKSKLLKWLAKKRVK